MYAGFKTVHLSFALISFSMFMLRSFLMLTDSPWQKHKLILIAPHLIDTVFIVSGFSMAFILNFGLFSQAWLTTKLALLMLYLFLVGVALARGTTRKVRVTAFFLAVFTYLSIVGVAINKSPLGWLA